MVTTIIDISPLVNNNDGNLGKLSVAFNKGSCCVKKKKKTTINPYQVILYDHVEAYDVIITCDCQPADSDVHRTLAAIEVQSQVKANLSIVCAFSRIRHTCESYQRNLYHES